MGRFPRTEIVWLIGASLVSLIMFLTNAASLTEILIADLGSLGVVLLYALALRKEEQEEDGLE